MALITESNRILLQSDDTFWYWLTITSEEGGINFYCDGTAEVDVPEGADPYAVIADADGNTYRVSLISLTEEEILFVLVNIDESPVEEEPSDILLTLEGTRYEVFITLVEGSPILTVEEENLKAPNIFEIYKFETHLTNASTAVLTHAGITSSYAQQDNSNLSTPRVELQPVVGSPLGHYYLSGSMGYHDSWNAQMQVVVITERTNNPTFHYDFTSKVIALLSDTAQLNSGSNLPYHKVVRSTYNGSTPSVEADDNIDLSVLSFVLTVWVKPTSWL